MSPDSRPVIVAYDGSDEARRAVRAAAELFGGHPLIIVSVWEPGLALAMASMRDPTGVAYMPPSAAETEAIDEAQHDHAVEAAEDGARLARELGATAEAYSVPDEVRVAETILAVAEERDAGAVVVGSRGLGALKSRLFGSTSHDVLHRTHRPVLVVRAPE
jgi:nucleotide-binding universal stress UspA family protein